MSPRAGVVSTSVGLGAFGLYLLLALGRWNDGRVSGYDLGIFSQSAQSWSRGKLPFSGIRGIGLLGDHFSPITVLFGAAWRVWPDPRSLLVVQAACLGLAVGLIAFHARTLRTPRLVALVLVTAVFGRGVLTSALFDVHEVAFAAPSMVGLCIALIRRRFGLALVCGGILLLTKEDLGASVCAAGLAWWLLRRRDGERDLVRPAVLVVLGVCGVGVAFLTLKHFSVTGGSEYISHFGQKNPVQTHDVSQWLRLAPLGLAVASALVVGLRSPLFLLAVPTVAWRMLSSDFHYWSLDWHYDLVPWAACTMAAIDGLAGTRLKTRFMLLVAAGATTTLLLGVFQISARGTSPERWFDPAPDVKALYQLDRDIPRDGVIAAPNWISPYFVGHHDVVNLTSRQAQPFRYVAIAPHEWHVAPYAKCVQAWVEALTPGEHPTWRAGKAIVVDLGRNTVRQPLPCRATQGSAQPSN